jgi:hypothetical protein
MRRTTIGFLAGILSAALGALLWNRRPTLVRPRASARPAKDEVTVVDYARLAEGII